jgi:argininosuccinate lyase
MTNKTLWQKNATSNPIVGKFTVGRDKEFDLLLAPFDIKASLAHARMLCKTELITSDEFILIEAGLLRMLGETTRGTFLIDEGAEDVHSQIELRLTKELGSAGKKIHTARSRNDQVLTAIKLFLKHEHSVIRTKALSLKSILNDLSSKHQHTPLPGYTHLQLAMPSTFGLWFGAYADSFDDDLLVLEVATAICDKNPLGSAAGYGTSFAIDKKMTTEELGFSSFSNNPVYAQMTRGKSERFTAVALAAIASTLARFSYDICLFMCQNFDFISFENSYCTGSSIMPHKNNPDIFELVRAKCNIIQGIPNQLTLLTSNLPSGYHRDMQLTKETLFPAIKDLKDCLDILCEVLPSIKCREGILDEEKYKHLFSVNEIDRLVKTGIPFRDAYLEIAKKIENGEFVATDRSLSYLRNQ